MGANGFEATREQKSNVEVLAHKLRSSSPRALPHMPAALYTPLPTHTSARARKQNGFMNYLRVLR
jgi:hypothetical protein